MEDMMRKSTMLTPTKWLRQAFEDMKGELISEHFDYFIGYEKENPKGLDLLLYAVNIINEADVMRKEVLKKRKNKTIIPMVYLPLEDTQKISFWQDSYWNDLGKDFEPPSLYLLPKIENFDVFSQEYRTPIKCPLKTIKIKPVFRSFRRPYDIENDEPFSNGIYLYCEGECPASN